MKTEDTVVAQATPHGHGSISVIRLSGEDSLKIVNKITKTSEVFVNRVATLRTVYISKNKEIDRSVFTFFKQPNSYTGEDVVEISCHGNPFVVQSIISLCCKYGARIAEPGEFTKRAFLNKKLDLVQAEAVGDLISARSEEAAVHQNKNLSGFVSLEVNNIKNSVLSVLSSIEFELDISESENNLSQNVNNYRKLNKNNILSIKNILKSYKMGLAYTSGVRVVLLGRPNVGKSTLMNQILKKERSITSGVSGTTRDTVSSEMIFSGVPVTLIDTAGIVDSKNPIEREGVLRTTKEVEKADIVLSLSAPDINEVLIDDLKKVVSVFNKVDALKEKPRLKNVFYISALKGEGIKELMLELEKKLVHNNPSTNSTINNLRQHESLLKSSRSLLRASELLKESAFVELELVAFELRSAINHLEVFLGKITSEDLLDSVFSGFCVGK